MAEELSEARHAPRDLGRGGPQPQDGARGDALARAGPRAARTPDASLTNVLDPRIAKAEREAALGQAAQGADLDRRLSLVAGRPAVALHDALHPVRLRQGGASSAWTCRRTWSSAAGSTCAEHYRDEYATRDGRGQVRLRVGVLTFLNYVALVLPRPVVDGRRASRRPSARQILDVLVQALEGALAVPQGLPRADAASGWAAPQDARLVWASVMDSAKTDPDHGTYWAPEDRAWLWYNDTIETHAFALRTLDGARPDGPAAARPGAVALPQQEAQPVEVDARHRRGASTRWSGT